MVKRIKTGNLRRELLGTLPSLEEMVSEESIVRLIDVFVDQLDIESHGFKINHKNIDAAGAPQYAPSDLLKIYLYGYVNRTRSSRQLERCCKINIEMMWLINGLTPGYVSIANFRKNNSKPLKQVFRTYNRFLNSQGLFGKKTVAVDGSKFRAQNAKSNNFNDNLVERRLKYIDRKTAEYLALLEQSDEAKNQEKSSAEINERLEQLAERKIKYGKLKSQLDEVKKEGQKQISTVDPDARLFTSVGSKGVIAYNVQSVVDAEHCLIVENDVTNTGDQNALYEMVCMAKDVLGVEHIEALADSGYDTGEELMKCAKGNIVAYVSPRRQSGGGQRWWVLQG